MSKCKQCGKEFKPKRATALFCSPACRVAFNREVSVTDSVTKVSVTEKTDAKSVTLRKDRMRDAGEYLSDEWIENYISQYVADICGISLKDAKPL